MGSAFVAGHDDAPRHQSESAFWAESEASCLSGLSTDGLGLSSREAVVRLGRFGLNLLTHRDRMAAIIEAGRRVLNPLAVILLIAAVISAALGQRVDAGVIALIVIFSTTIDLWQAHRSHLAAERLRQRIEMQTAVRRDGVWTELATRLLVPGDRIRVQTGDIVPADARVLQSSSLYLDEAAFTGESLPVEKDRRDRVESPLAAEAANALFMGTVVTGGSGEAVVVRTGRDTTYGELAERLQRMLPASAFDRGLRDFGSLIARTVVVLVIFVVAVNILAHRDPFESVLFAVALAVGLTPEFLPMILTVTQAEGAVRMARAKVIVRQLPAIQNFGSFDVLCSDKTGTLTEGRMQVNQYIDPGGDSSERVRRFAYLNAVAQHGLRSPFDEALLAAPPADTTSFEDLGEIPYDFVRRRLSVLLALKDGPTLITLGAPESVISVCNRVRRLDAEAPLDAAAIAQIERSNDNLGAQGFRLLAVATRSFSGSSSIQAAEEKELVFEGMVAFSDPPKEDVAAVIEALHADGVALKVLTGDAESVTRHVCGAIGLGNQEFVAGSTLDRLGEAELGDLVQRANVFTRVSPDQKLRIIRALQAHGRVVGYLGDGINDAPSLRAADVGISVSGAVDVARDAADVILVEKNLRVLHDGIIEGRKSFGNVIKYVMMGTSSNFGNMLSMAGAVLLLPFLPMLPPQILLNNALYDLAQVTIPTDHVDAAMIQRPHQWDMRFVRDFMLIFGPISSLYDFLTFFVLRTVLHADATLFHTGWFIESLATQTLVIFVIRTVGNPLRSRPSAPLAATVVLVVAVAAILPWTPIAPALGFAAPPVAFMVFVALATLTYLALVEAAKRVFYRTHPLAGSSAAP
jgi:Mg2+-importing ATPase